MPAGEFRMSITLSIMFPSTSFAIERLHQSFSHSLETLEYLLVGGVKHLVLGTVILGKLLRDFVRVNQSVHEAAQLRELKLLRRFVLQFSHCQSVFFFSHFNPPMIPLYNKTLCNEFFS